MIRLFHGMRVAWNLQNVYTHSDQLLVSWYYHQISKPCHPPWALHSVMGFHVQLSKDDLPLIRIPILKQRLYRGKCEGFFHVQLIQWSHFQNRSINTSNICWKPQNIIFGMLAFEKRRIKTHTHAHNTQNHTYDTYVYNTSFALSARSFIHPTTHPDEA